MEDFEKKVTISEPVSSSMEVEQEQEQEKTNSNASSPKSIVDLLRKFLAVQQRRAHAYARLKRYVDCPPPSQKKRKKNTLKRIVCRCAFSSSANAQLVYTAHFVKFQYVNKFLEFSEANSYAGMTLLWYFFLFVLYFQLLIFIRFFWLVIGFTFFTVNSCFLNFYFH